MDFLSEIGVLTKYPAIALIPAAIFFGIYWWSRKHLALGTAIAWSLYLAYELGMKLHVLCSGDCNIRVDLLLIYPALIVLSITCVFAIVVAQKKRLPSIKR